MIQKIKVLTQRTNHFFFFFFFLVFLERMKSTSLVVGGYLWLVVLLRLLAHRPLPEGVKHERSSRLPVPFFVKRNEVWLSQRLRQNGVPSLKSYLSVVQRCAGRDTVLGLEETGAYYRLWRETVLCRFALFWSWFKLFYSLYKAFSVQHEC